MEKNITEDYVSFEVAKLLKEKGFNEFTQTGWGAYDNKKEPRNFISDNGRGGWYDTKKEWLSRPTLQMVMKWLRELYDIHIVIFPSSFIYGDKYTYSIYYKRTKKDENYQLHFQSRAKTFEGAANEAIEHCLTKLI